jgi:phosphotransferase system HPr (HPr) family protein
VTKREITVTNTLGIHARPASMLVKAAAEFTSKISLEKDDVRADAKSIMNVMMLAASFGSKVTIRASGEDEEAAVAALAELFEQKFNED